MEQVIIQGYNPPISSVSGNPVYIGGLDTNASMVGASFTNNGELKVSGAVGGIASVVSFQGGSWIISGSVATVGTAAANQSVSGAVAVSNFPTTQNVSGSVATFLGGSTNASVITVGTPAANQSVSGTVNIGNYPTSQNISGSVFAVGSVTTLQGTNPWFVQLTSGSVITTGANSSVQVVGVLPNTSVSGVGTFNVNPVGNGSVFAVLRDSSVATLQGTNPWHITGSVLAVPSQGASMIAVLQSPSIVGTYAEDTAHTTGDKGLFVLQVRNDTMASVTTTTGEYSPFSGGPIGETIVANSPISRWVTGFASITSGADTPLIAAGGASVFTYITSAQLSMFPGAVNQVSFKNSAGGTIVSRMYLPSSTAGISLVFTNPLKTLANGAFIASIGAIGSVLVNVQGFRSSFDV